jgi:hypothetical protein
LTQAESASALLLVVALRAEVAAAPLLVAVVISLLAKTIAETATMTDETAIALGAQMIGKLHHNCRLVIAPTYTKSRDRDTKEDHEEVHENGTSGEDRKGNIALSTRSTPNNC